MWIYVLSVVTNCKLLNSWGVHHCTHCSVVYNADGSSFSLSLLPSSYKLEIHEFRAVYITRNTDVLSDHEHYERNI